MGAYAPAHVVTNAVIASRVDTSDEWISTRTGVREGRLRPGDLLLLAGFGGGLTWATTVVRYGPLGAEECA